MATYTTNYNLEKPEATDPFGDFRQSYNDNLDIIDANLGGGGGGGHTIVDENGSDMPAESKLQFTGNVSVTDDNVNGATVVDVLGGGGNVYGAFIDPSRIIKASESVASGTTSTYTATEDCAVHIVFVGSTNPSRVYIDGVELETHYASQLAFVTHVLYVRKGQVFSLLSGDNSTNYTVYGLTQGTNGIYSPVIYSDNERVIGVWRDNKPLYAKTWVLTVPSATGTYSFNEATPNLENVVHTEYSLWGLGERSSTPWYTPATILFSEQTASYIEFYFESSNYAGRKIYFTSYYTKTTDNAGSGNWNTDGVPTHHYSTSEQVIGTWYNGKPIYQKVLTPTVGAGYNSLAHGISDLDECIKIWGTCKYNNRAEWLSLPYVSTALNYEITLGNVTASNYILEAGAGFTSFEDVRIVIEYTKTTD